MTENDRLDDLCSMFNTLVGAAKSHLDQGIESADTDELMSVVDMIKDLAEAKKDCLKACYYKTVVEAMENSDESEQYGYHNFREHRKTPIQEIYYPDETISEEMNRRYRMGYHDRTIPHDANRYGIAYEEYKDARKHYTETKSEVDKEEMDRHIREHVSDTLSTMMDMYHAADPELRKQIKANITKLAADMT